MKKKIILAGLIPAVILSLAGCSGVAQSASFDKVEYEIPPEWDNEKSDFLGWGNGEELNAVDAYGEGYISYRAVDDDCNLYAATFYDDSWKEPRGAEFNSYDYVFNMMGTGISQMDGAVNTVQIDGVTFAQAGFTSEQTSRTDEKGKKETVQRLAVRVFDTPIESPLFGNEVEGEGMYGSDLSVWLPGLSLNLSCSADTTPEKVDKLWNDAIDRLAIKFKESKEGEVNSKGPGNQADFEKEIASGGDPVEEAETPEMVIGEPMPEGVYGEEEVATPLPEDGQTTEE